MPDLKPLSIAIYRRGPAWVDGRKLRDQETLLDHGRFLAALERSGQAVHAGPAHRLDEVPVTDPIGMASFPCAPAEASALLRDDPGLTSGLLLCDVLPWHVTDALRVARASSLGPTRPATIAIRTVPQAPNAPEAISA